MFYKTLFAFSLFLLATLAVVYWDHIRLRSTDPAHYQLFVKENSAERARHALETHPATQHRQTVQKDFWIPQGKERQHLRILSQQSELILHERKGKLEAVEKLHNLECWLQEIGNGQTSILHKGAFVHECPDAPQQVRHLTAEEGIYFYPTHHFIAQIVQLQFFRLPGNELPENVDPNLAFFSGTATEASFSACGKNPTFTAQHLHATFDPTRGLP